MALFVLVRAFLLAHLDAPEHPIRTFGPILALLKWGPMPPDLTRSRWDFLGRAKLPGRQEPSQDAASTGLDSASPRMLPR
jgi:hypothetical protein